LKGVQPLSEGLPKGTGNREVAVLFAIWQNCTRTVWSPESRVQKSRPETEDPRPLFFRFPGSNTSYHHRKRLWHIQIFKSEGYLVFSGACLIDLNIRSNEPLNVLASSLFFMKIVRDSPHLGRTKRMILSA